MWLRRECPCRLSPITHVILSAILLFPLWAHGQLSSTQTITYTGRILNGADNAPLAGATVVLLPCTAATGTHTEHAIQTTADDGIYKFDHISWPCAFIVAAYKGFSGGRSNSSQNSTAIKLNLEDVKLWPVASPIQVETSAIASAYGPTYAFAFFRDASFSPDGETLNFSSEDGGRGGGLKGWSYSLKNRTLQTGPVQPFQTDIDVVGSYRIDESHCRGCDLTITAQNTNEAKPNLITSNISAGLIASSDASAVLWGESNAKDDSPVLGLYVLATHQRKRLVLPGYVWLYGGPLAARPEGDGYLVAYQMFGPCTPDAEYIARLAEDQPFRESPAGRASLCFIHIPVPSR